MQSRSFWLPGEIYFALQMGRARIAYKLWMNTEDETLPSDSNLAISGRFSVPFRKRL
jgi:hypothetical protein